jgi:hypothetical protein
MINFFRKIRKKLADDNQLLKYSRYAIGEILLVVIGILIALSINNWNEFKKERTNERKIIAELIENMEFNHIRFEDFINGGQYYDSASDYVISVLNKERMYTDTLDNVLNMAIQRRGGFSYSKIGYESLKNKGFDIILNDSLRKSIITIYEEVYPEMMGGFKWGNESQPEYLDHHFLPVPKEHGLNWKPYNFEVQMNDNYFKSLIHKIKIQRKFHKMKVARALEESKKVQQQLIDELNKSITN